MVKYPNHNKYKNMIQLRTNIYIIPINFELNLKQCLVFKATLFDTTLYNETKYVQFISSKTCSKYCFFGCHLDFLSITFPSKMLVIKSRCVRYCVQLIFFSLIQLSSSAVSSYFKTYSLQYLVFVIFLYIHMSVISSLLQRCPCFTVICQHIPNKCLNQSFT